MANNKTIRFSIEGMHCGNCAASVEKTFQQTPGVISVVVNLASNSAVVAYDSKITNVEKLTHALDKTNFSATVLVDVFEVFSESTKNIQTKNLKIDLIKLIVAIVLTVFVLILHYVGGHNLTSNILMLALTIPVQFWCGWSFIRGGWKSVVSKNPNMDLLVALGTLIAFFYSVYICFVGGRPAFETSCMLIAFISFGEYIEARAKGQTNKVVEGLVKLIPENFNAQPGDIIEILPGEVIGADGEIVKGETFVDESMLTGESDLIAKTVGDEVYAGTNNTNSKIQIKVIHSKETSVLSKIIRAVMDAQSSKAPVARIADKIAGVFVPVVLILALITFIVWMIIYDGAVSLKLQQALMCAVSILTVSCPCALVLATPITLTVAMGKGAELGIIIRDGAVLELLPKVKHIVFDKTGTLTQSNLDKNVMASKNLRPDAKETIATLQSMQILTYMISGDKKDEAFRIANMIGIAQDNVVYEADPLSKKEHLTNLMATVNNSEYKDVKFAYVGDGINDAPAMAIADIGIALENATDIALESGNVVLMHNKLKDLVTAIRLSCASMRKIKQNLFWALCYNVVMIPLAALGIVIPMWCGVIHAISSLIVVFNALVLKRFK